MAEAKKVKEAENIIIFKANKQLTKAEFNLLSDMVAKENKKKGVKIILMPYSCDLGSEADGK